jgi:hypothetical protein
LVLLFLLMCRGLLAAGGLNAAGQWQVCVWDAYTGHMDRQLSGPPAHMLMAALSQELTSSMQHVKRTQQRQQQAGSSSSGVHLASAGGSADMSAAGGIMGGSSRQSLDAGYGVGVKDALSSSHAGAAAAAAHAASTQFVPRLQLVQHNSGPIRALPNSRQDVLLLDINLQQLLLQLEAHTRQQQQRSSSRQRQHAGGRSSLSIDGESWLPSGAISRPGSLDLSTSLQGGTEQAYACSQANAAAAAAAAGAAADSGLSRQGSGVSSHSHLSAVAEVSEFSAAPQHGAGSQQQQQQRSRQVAPAVSLALQALCVLHCWGCDSQLDEQLAAMLQEAGMCQGIVLPQQQQQQPAELASAVWSAGQSLDDHFTAAAAGDGDGGSNGSRGMSPSGPEQAAANTQLLASVPASPTAPPSSAAADHHQRHAKHGMLAAPSSSSGSGQLQHEQLLLHQLAQLLQDAPSNACNTPQLLRVCPCLSQAVLLSGNGAMALALPTARAAAACQVQQQQQVALAGVLLKAAPSLLSCR